MTPSGIHTIYSGRSTNWPMIWLSLRWPCRWW